MPTPDLMQCAECLCLASRQAARAITRAFDRELRPHNVRVTQFSLLAQLHLRGPLSLNALAHALGIERTTLTRNLVPIERQGLVTLRIDDEDARSRIVTLTAKGRGLLTAAFPSWRKAQASVSAAIGAGAADSLRKLAKSTHR